MVNSNNQKNSSKNDVRTSFASNSPMRDNLTHENPACEDNDKTQSNSKSSLLKRLFSSLGKKQSDLPPNLDFGQDQTLSTSQFGVKSEIRIMYDAAAFSTYQQAQQDYEEHPQDIYGATQNEFAEKGRVKDRTIDLVSAALVSDAPAPRGTLPDAQDLPQVSKTLPTHASNAGISDAEKSELQNSQAHNEDIINSDKVNADSDDNLALKGGVVFVDSNMPDIDVLLSGVDDEMAIVLIDQKSDGLQQIADFLKEYDNNIPEIHIISHGGAGYLELGQKAIDFNTLTIQQQQYLRIIGNALHVDADMLIYGCDFAAGDIGRTAVDKIHVLTDADIAASDDISGDEAQGGDWQLEYELGNIDTSVIISQQARLNWNYIMLGNSYGIVGDRLQDDISNDTTPVLFDKRVNIANVDKVHLTSSFALGTVSSSNGTWSFSVDTPLAQGTYTINANYKDAAGASLTTNNFTIVIDTSINTTNLTLDSSSDSHINNDRITSDNLPKFTGQVSEDNVTVALYRDGQFIKNKVTSGAWTLTSIFTSDGQHSFYITTQDQAGNIATSTNIETLIIDTAVQPTTSPDLSPSSDSGSSQSDNVTNEKRPIFTGNNVHEAQSTLTLLANNQTIYSDIVGSGFWTVTTDMTGFVDAQYSITTIIKDRAGNVNTSSALQITLDTTIQTAGVPLLRTAAGGLSNMGALDIVTIAGVGDVNGDIVRVINSQTNSEIGRSFVFGGEWELNNQVTLRQGMHTLHTIFEDSAGNTRTSIDQTIIIDTTVPQPDRPRLLSPSNTLTNSDDIQLLGTGAEAGNTVYLYDNGITISSQIARSDGSWVQALTDLPDGDHVYTVQFKDNVTDISGISQALTITIDTTLVADYSRRLLASTDTGDSQIDLITSNNQPVFFGSQNEAGSTVSLVSGTRNLGTVLATSTGWTLTIKNALADSEYEVVMTLRDRAGNFIADTNPTTLTIDTTIVIKENARLLESTNSGASSTDNITNIKRPTFVGEGGLASDTITLKDQSGLQIGSTYVGRDGTWTIASRFDLNNTLQIRAYYQDIAGNMRTQIQASTIIVDTQAPNRPLNVDLLDGSDSGSNSTDNITNDVAPIFVGIGGERDATAFVRISHIGGTFLGGTALVEPNGQWTVSTQTNIRDQQYSVNVYYVDHAGNVTSDSNPLNVTLDTTMSPISAPDLPVAFDSGDGSGITLSDDITNASPLQITGTGGSRGDVTKLYEGSRLLQTGAVALDANNNSVWSFNFVENTEGEHQYHVVVTDTAGNSVTSTTLTVTIDRSITAISESIGIVKNVANDTGFSQSDGVTQNSNPTFVGKGGDEGDIVTAYSGSNQVIGTTMVGAQRDWTISSNITFNEGSNFISKVTIRDIAGKEIVDNTVYQFVVDRTITPVSTPDLLTRYDTGRETDNITSSTRHEFAGSGGKINDTVILLENNVAVASLIQTQNNLWAIHYDQTIDKDYFYHVILQDAAGNSTTSQVLTVTLDSTIAIGTKTNILAPDDAPVVGDNVTSRNSLRLTGRGEVGDTVFISIPGNSLTTLILTQSEWLLSALNFSEGTHVITTTYKDIAGNVKNTEQTNIIVDNTPPVTPTNFSLVADTHVVGDYYTSDNDLTYLGTGNVNDTVQIYQNNVNIANVVVDQTGRWTHSVGALNDGHYNVALRVIDQAGNRSGFSQFYSVVIDRQAPNTPNLLLDSSTDSGASRFDAFTKFNELVFTNRNEPFATVSILEGVLTVGSTVANANGDWVITTKSLSDTTHTLTAVYVDLAGNRSIRALQQEILIDSTINSFSTPALTDASDTGTRGDRLTTLSRVTLHGSADETISRVTLVNQNNDAIGVVGANNGVWTITNANLNGDGTHVITAIYEDLAGNIRSSQTYTLVVDSSVPSFSDVRLSVNTDTNIAGDNITNFNNVVLQGNASEDGAKITVRDNTRNIEFSTIVNGGQWHIAPSQLVDGEYLFETILSDLAGNHQTGRIVTIVIDTSINTIAVPALAANFDAGLSSTDSITNISTPVFVGTAEAGGEIILLRQPGVTVGVTTVNARGEWTFRSPRLTDDNYAISAQFRDLAGNIGASVPLNLTIDTQKPTDPFDSKISAIDDPEDDNYTKNKKPVLVGNATASERGQQVNAYMNNLLLYTTIVENNLTWTISVDSALSEGRNIITTKINDVAGNLSSFDTITIIVDTNAPAVPTPTLENDSYFAADRITNNNQLIISDTVNENGLTVEIFNGNDIIASTLTVGGRWKITTSLLVDGTYNLVTKIKDKVANQAVSSIMTIIIDSSFYVATSQLATNSDSGISGFNNDNITYVSMPVFVGRNDGAFDTVKLSANGRLVASMVTMDNQWTMRSTSLGDGTYEITTQFTDYAGNTASAAKYTIIIDTKLEDIDPILHLTNDSNISDDYITYNNIPVFNGEAEIGATITLREDNGALVASLINKNSKDWTVTSRNAFNDGVYKIDTTIHDSANNRTVLAQQTLIIDRFLGGASIPDLTDVSDRAGDGDPFNNKTNLNFPVFTGTSTSQDGDTVTITFDGDGKGSAILQNGVWTVTAGPVTSNIYDVRAVLNDRAGNVFTSGIITINIDNAPPPPPNSFKLTDDTGISSTDLITYNSFPVFIGNFAVPGNTLFIKDNNVTIYTAVLSANSSEFTVTYDPGLSPGVHNITSYYIANNGVQGTLSAVFTVIIDDTLAITQQPSLHSDSGVQNDDITNVNKAVIKGQGDNFNDTVILYRDGNCLGSTQVNSTGDWFFTNNSLAANTYVFQAKYIDAAGNIRSSENYTIIIDDTIKVFSKPDLQASSDSGIRNNDNLTYVKNPVFTGTNDNDVNYVAVVDTTSNQTIGSVNLTVGATNWVITSSVALSDGSHNIITIYRDIANNIQTNHGAISITIDTVIESIGVTTLLNDKGISSSDNLTSDNKPIIAGAGGKSGDTITLYDANNAINSRVITANDWTITFASPLTEGRHNIKIEIKDDANNITYVGQRLVTIDTTIDSIDGLDLHDDSGIALFNNDNITNISTPRFVGRTDIDVYEVTLYNGRQRLGSIAPDINSFWTVTAPNLNDADSYSISVQYKDRAGNIVTSAILTLTIDTTILSSSSLTLLNTQGVFDHLINNKAPVFSGRSEENDATVSLTTSTGQIVGSTIVASNQWQLTSKINLTDETHAITVKYTDKAGNNITVTTSIIVDTTITSFPIKLTNDSNVTNDNITYNNIPIFAGQLDERATIGLVVGGNTVASEIFNRGAWTLTSSILRDDTYAIDIQILDDAGNRKTIHQTLIIDTRADAKPAIIDLVTASDSKGAKNDDNITYNTIVTFKGNTGITSTPTTITLYDDSSVIGTTLSNASTGLYTFTNISLLTDGEHSIRTKYKDLAGNISPFSDVVTIVIDTSITLAAAAKPILDVSSDSHFRDNISYASMPVFSGNFDNDHTVHLRVNGARKNSMVVAGGQWALTLSFTVDNSYNISAEFIDIAGNLRTSQLMTFILDRTISTTPLPIFPISQDSGVANNDRITYVSASIFTGVGEKLNDTVWIRVNDSATSASAHASTLVDSNKEWTISMETLKDGSYLVYTYYKDIAGNIRSLSNNITLIIDTTINTTPNAKLDNVINVSIKGDDLAADNKPNFVGRGEKAGDTVSLVLAGSTLHTSIRVDLTWTISSPSVKDDFYTVKATYYDDAGNIRTTDNYTIGIDTTIKSAPPPLIITADDSGISDEDQYTKINRPRFVGIGVDNDDTVIFTEKGSTLASLVIGASTWTISMGSFSDGTHIINGYIQDRVGNVRTYINNTIIIDTATETLTNLDLLRASDTLSDDHITQNTMPKFIGDNAEAHSTITIYGNDGSTNHTLGSVITNAVGRWTLDVTTKMADATYDIAAKYIDKAGNVSPLTAPIKIEVDTTIELPGALRLINDSNIGSDKISFNSVPIFEGTGGRDNDTIYLYKGNQLVSSKVINGNSWTITGTLLADGDYQFKVDIKDTAGNAKNTSVLTITVDTSIEIAAPVSLPASFDSNINNDRITNKNIIHLTGDTDNDFDTIKLYANGVSLGSVQAKANGNWTFTTQSLSDDVYSFTTKFKDRAGNERVDSTILTITIDTTIRSIEPTILHSDTGAVSGDTITNTSNPVFRGSAEKPNDTVTIYANNVKIASQVTGANGDWVITANTLTQDITYKIKTIYSDIAGNINTAPMSTIILDTSIKLHEAADLDASDDSGYLNNDNITYNTELLFVGQGRDEAFSTVRLLNAGATIASIIADSTGQWQITSLALAPGIHSIMTHFEDIAGNMRTAVNVTTILIDTTLPIFPQPVSLETSSGSDTGVLNDYITYRSMPVFIGDHGEEDTTASLYAENSGGTVFTLGVDVVDSNKWTITSTQTLPKDGTYIIYAYYTDKAGNVSSQGLIQTIILDTTIPSLILPQLDISSDIVARDYLTYDNTPLISGQVNDANVRVSVIIDGNYIGSTTSNASGQWSFTSTLLADGQHTITAQYTDLAGNQRQIISSQTFTIDTTIENYSGADLVASNDKGYKNDDNITYINEPILVGQGGKANDTITISVNSSTLIVGTTTASTWRTTLPSLADGNHIVEVSYKDTAGNIRVSPDLVTILVDTTIYSTTPAQLLDATNSGELGDNLTYHSHPVFFGKIAADSQKDADVTVKLYNQFNSLIATQVSDGQTWTMTSTSMISDATYIISTVYEDKAGNIRTDTTKLTLTIDTTIQIDTKIDLDNNHDLGDKNDDNITKQQTVNIDGDGGIVGDTVFLYDQNRVFYGSTILTNHNRWTLSDMIFARDYSYILNTKFIDDARNIRTGTNTMTLVIDTTIPANTLINLDDRQDSKGDFSTDNITYNTILTFNGNGGEKHDTVYLMHGSNVKASIIMNSDNQWTLSDLTFNDGTYIFNTKFIDKAGNIRSDNVYMTLVVDTTIQLQPKISFHVDTGISNQDGLTFDTKPTFVGSLDKLGDSVLIKYRGVLVGSHTSTLTTAWSIDYNTTLVDGSYAFDVFYKDVAGNFRTAPSQLTLMVDTTIATGGVANLFNSDDTGELANDNITYKSLLNFDGRGGLKDDTVKLMEGSNTIGTTILIADNQWTLTNLSLPAPTSNLDEHTHLLQVIFQDNAGNIRTESSILTVIIDETVTNRPSVSLHIDSDFGDTTNDNITYANRPVFTGEIDRVGDTVTLLDMSDSNKTLGSMIVTASNKQYTITSLHILSDSTHEILAIFNDKAGNVRTAVKPLTLLIDTTIKSQADLDIAAIDDKGRFDNDDLSYVTKPRVIGDSASVGDTVFIHVIGKTDAVASLVTSAENWTLSAPLNDGDKTYDLYIKWVDPAGNIRSSEVTTFILDTQAPTSNMTNDLTNNSDSGINNDNNTFISTPSFTGAVSSNNDIGHTVHLYADGATVASTLVENDRSFTLSSITVADKTYIFTTSLTDHAGNVSSMKAALTVIIDTTIDHTQRILFFNDDDLGDSSTDGITYVNNPLLQGKTDRAGDKVVVFSQNNVTLGTRLTDANNDWTLRLSLGVIPDGTYSFHAEYKDIAGNIRTSSLIRTYILDRTIEAISQMTLVTDTGTDDNDRLTNMTKPVFAGQGGKIDDTVTIIDTSDNNKTLGTAFMKAGGLWTLTLNESLTDGSHNLQALYSDKAGNLRTYDDHYTVTIDTTIESASAPALLQNVDNDTNILGDYITHQTQPIFVGSGGKEGNSVVVNISNGYIFTSIVHSTTTWTITANTIFADGDYELSTTYYDDAGNIRTLSNPLTLRIDTTIESFSAPDLYEGSDSGFKSDDNLTYNQTPIFIGDSGREGDTVIIKDSNGVTIASSFNVGSDGGWTVTTTSFIADGTHELTSFYYDRAGNIRTSENALTIEIDVSNPDQPAAPRLSSDSNFNDNVTYISTPTFVGGNIEENARLQIITNGNVLNTVFVDNSTGNYTISQLSILADGTHEIQIQTIDYAGNISSISEILTIIVDTTIEQEFIDGKFTVSIIADDTNIRGDYITTQTTPTFYGTDGKIGDTIRLFSDGTLIRNHIVSDSDWTTSHVLISEGTHTISWQIQDQAGNLRSNTHYLTIVIDTTIESIKATILNPNDDSKTRDNLTYVSTPVFYGSGGKAGDTITLMDLRTNQTFGITTIQNDQTWTLSTIFTDDGSYQLTAVYKDISGNYRLAETLTFNLDRTIFNINTPNLDPFLDSGNRDNLTNIKNNLRFFGSGAANSESITVYISGTQVSTQILASNFWNYVHNTALSDNTYSLVAKFEDHAGNIRTSPIYTFVVDTTIESTGNPDLIARDDSGYLDSDNITYVSTPTFTGTGGRKGDTVYLLSGNVGFGVALASMVITTDDEWTITSPSLADGDYSLRINFVDTATNVRFSEYITLTIDTSPSNPPVIAFEDREGISTLDNLSYNSYPVFTGALSETATTATIYTGSQSLGTFISDARQRWTITSNIIDIDGTYIIKALTVDKAGNISSFSNAVTFVLDRTIESIKPLVLAPGNDTLFTNDNITYISTPTFIGAGGKIGDTATFYHEGSLVYTKIITDHRGEFTMSSLTDGFHNFQVEYSDDAGNIRTGGALKILVDTTINSADALSLKTSDDSGVFDFDRITNVTTPTFSGVGEPFSTVYIRSGDSVIATTFANVNGFWQITSDILPDATHSITLQYRDPAGNLSNISDALTVIIDTFVPFLSPVTFFDGDDTGRDSLDFITNNTTPIFIGSGGTPGDNVQLYIDGIVEALATVKNDGSYTLEVKSPMVHGQHNVSYKFLDTAGNVKFGASEIIVTDIQVRAVNETTLAQISDSGALNNDGITNVTQPIFTGTAEAKNDIAVYSGDRLIGRGVSDVNGLWTVTSFSLDDGNHNITVRQTDIAGNVSEPSPATTIFIDTQMPPTPGAPLISGFNSGGFILPNEDIKVIGGSELRINSRVLLFSDDILVGSQLITREGAGYSFDTKTSAAKPGFSSFTVKITSPSGNISDSSQAFTYRTSQTNPLSSLISPSIDSSVQSSSTTSTVRAATFSADIFRLSSNDAQTESLNALSALSADVLFAANNREQQILNNQRLEMSFIKRITTSVSAFTVSMPNVIGQDNTPQDAPANSGFDRDWIIPGEYDSGINVTLSAISSLPSSLQNLNILENINLDIDISKAVGFNEINQQLLQQQQRSESQQAQDALNDDANNVLEDLIDDIENNIDSATQQQRQQSDDNSNEIIGQPLNPSNTPSPSTTIQELLQQGEQQNNQGESTQDSGDNNVSPLPPPTNNDGFVVDDDLLNDLLNELQTKDKSDEPTQQNGDVTQPTPTEQQIESNQSQSSIQQQPSAIDEGLNDTINLEQDEDEESEDEDVQNEDIEVSGDEEQESNQEELIDDEVNLEQEIDETVPKKQDNKNNDNGANTPTQSNNDNNV